MTMIPMLSPPRMHTDEKRWIPTWLLEREGDIAPTKVTLVAHSDFLS